MIQIGGSVLIVAIFLERVLLEEDGVMLDSKKRMRRNVDLTHKRI
jgi:hypothetical protein